MRRVRRRGVARIDRYCADAGDPSAEPARRVVVGPRIVGVGASAGGLEALQKFFANVPRQSGLAYVVVQHLDPSQPALLSQLLQRVTPMPVQEAREGVFIEADQVYVIPPNRALTVAAGQLHLAPPIERRGMRMPIDALFESLALDQGAAAVVVVLSGMGADGTLGSQAVRARGGLTLAQSPSNAQFDAMPRSAIAANCVDIVADVSDMPARILATRASRSEGGAADAPAPRGAASPPDAAAASNAPVALEDSLDESAHAGLAGILQLLLEQTRQDFSQYKRSTLLRRIERRLRAHGLETTPAYLQFLRANPQELKLLGKELLIGVTSFFRDRAEWQTLAERGLPQLVARCLERAALAPPESGSVLRAWVVGCSTGEEAYTLAMLLREALDASASQQAWTIRIFATDLSADAIDTARRGSYARGIEADVSAQRLERFFTPQNGSYRVAKNIRESVVFAQHDVNADAPFTKLDILCCRNLLIYLTAPLQARLMRMFHYSLTAAGLLMLGTSESVGRNADLFEPLDRQFRIFQRRDRPSVPGEAYIPTRRTTRPPAHPKEPAVAEPEVANPNLQSHADRLLLEEFSPPAVLVNPAGDILYIHGRTGKYLEPAAGKANWNIHAMAREGLRGALAGALREASASRATVHLTRLVLADTQPELLLDLTVREVHEPGALAGTLLIVFHDRPLEAPAPPGRGKSRALRTELQVELERARQEMQVLREEMKASHEELQASNEELQSTNEELQSTNEELTSSKEEMQSMNEELLAVNAELKTKLEDLALAQSDMKNLLDSTQIATLFLDNQFNVRRFTAQARSIVNLRDTDIGRPLSDLTTSLDYPDLQADARETLRTLATCEKQIASHDGRWFSVRIMPYRSLDDVIRGVVITLVDITTAKQLEAKLRAA